MMRKNPSVSYFSLLRANEQEAACSDQQFQTGPLHRSADIQSRSCSGFRNPSGSCRHNFAARLSSTRGDIRKFEERRSDLLRLEWFDAYLSVHHQAVAEM
jgi:hypothetical protein